MVLNEMLPFSAKGSTTVTSFNGRTGDVVPATGDYTVEQITGAATTENPVFTGNIIANSDSNEGQTNCVILGENSSTSGESDNCFLLGKNNSIDFSDAQNIIVIGTDNHTVSYQNSIGFNTVILGHGNSLQIDENYNLESCHIIGNYNNLTSPSNIFVIGSDNSISAADSFYDSFVFGSRNTIPFDENGTPASVYNVNLFGSNNTIKNGNILSVFGQYCKNEDYGEIDSGYYDSRLIVGGGTLESNRRNCFRVTDEKVFGGTYQSTGADYAEMFEWADDNPNGEDRVGLFVTLDGEKIKVANSNDNFILGVVSGNPSICGDAHDDQWHNQEMRDVFGRIIYENVTIPAKYSNDAEHKLVSPEHVERRAKVNPYYNHNEKYVPRSSRKEWAAVGIMGKLVVIDDGTCEVNGWAKVSDDGIATESTEQTKYRVMSRIDDTHIKILIL